MKLIYKRTSLTAERHSSCAKAEFQLLASFLDKSPLPLQGRMKAFIFLVFKRGLASKSSMRMMTSLIQFFFTMPNLFHALLIKHSRSGTLNKANTRTSLLSSTTTMMKLSAQVIACWHPWMLLAVYISGIFQT